MGKVMDGKADDGNDGAFLEKWASDFKGQFPLGDGTKMRWPNRFFQSSRSWDTYQGRSYNIAHVLIMESKSWTRSDTYAMAWGRGISTHKGPRLGTTWTMPRKFR